MKLFQISWIVFFFGFSSITFAQNSEKRFEKVQPKESGIFFRNDLKEDQEWNIFTYFNLYNGGGIAVGDLNNDGLPEVFFTSNMGKSILYKNNGALEFDDITKYSGIEIGDNRWNTAVTMADVNGDGWLDIYICAAGGKTHDQSNRLYVNNRDLTFTEKASDLGISDVRNSTDATFFDADNDGDLDLYVVNHPEDFHTSRVVRSKKESLLNVDESDALYIQNEKGIFTEKTKLNGVSNWAFGLSVTAGDLNDDGYIDLYVANDYSEKDNYWVNQGNGTFKEGIFNSFNHISNFSMGSDIGDVNNDGRLDLSVVDMMAADSYRKKTNMSGMNPEVFWNNVKEGRHYQYMQNVLQLNNGNGTFSDVASLTGMSNTDWSWTTLFADFDNDGRKDVLITNGIRRDVRNNDYSKNLIGLPLDWINNHADSLLALMPVQKLRNYIYQNNGELSFTNVASKWGITYDGFTNGAMAADLDNDGDLDLLFNNLDDVASLYENKSNENNYLRCRLLGPNMNRDGLGAKITIKIGNEIQVQEITSSRGFLSSSEPIAHFGLGNFSVVDELKIVWPGGKVQRLSNIKANKEIEIDYRLAQFEEKEVAEVKLIRERNKRSGINYTHKENIYDDFEQEMLLPYKYSQLGPSLAIGDINNDQLEDVYVGGAAGTSGNLLIQKLNGSFESKPIIEDLIHQSNEDQGACFFDVDNDNDLDLYIVSGSNEWAEGSIEYRDRLLINDGLGNFTFDSLRLPDNRMSGSCAAEADWDNDGDLDLFVGGRMIPKKYPYPASSILLQNNNGKFTPAEEKVFPGFREMGMVTDAKWADLDKDDDLDLIVSVEWQSVKIFRNDGNKFEEITIPSGLSKYIGWWSSLAIEDLNGDSYPDIIAGNLGINSRYFGSDEKPFEVYAGDFDDNQMIDIVLSTGKNNNAFPIRGKQCSAEQIPSLEQKFKTYDAYAKSTIHEIYGDRLDSALHYSANWMYSSVFFNNGDGSFKIEKLPIEAQVSSVQAIELIDVDSDGVKEIVLAGNLHQMEVETPRQDASVGLIIRFEDGIMKASSVNETGFFAYGDIKDLKGILDGKNRQLIITVANDGPVRLFQCGN